jgi:hypothetical protein
MKFEREEKLKERHEQYKQQVMQHQRVSPWPELLWKKDGGVCRVRLLP